MKKLITIVLLASSLNAMAAIECEKKDGRWYPKNEQAVQIAQMLGVKTCSGKRFKDVVAKLGEKSNVTATKQNMSVDEVLAQLKKK